jgi:hypothetical protein
MGAAAAQESVDFAGAAAFPAFDDGSEVAAALGGGGFDEGVDVVGHDDPRIEPVGGAVPGEQAGDEQGGAVGSGEHTFAVARVEQAMIRLLTWIF